MNTVPTPTTALALDEINPASFDFWLRDDVEGALAKLRHERPVAWHEHPDSGKGFWSTSRARRTSRAHSGPAAPTSAWAHTWRVAR